MRGISGAGFILISGCDSFFIKMSAPKTRKEFSFEKSGHSSPSGW
jgi:hypothetical protein